MAKFIHSTLSRGETIFRDINMHKIIFLEPIFLTTLYLIFMPVLSSWGIASQLLFLPLLAGFFYVGLRYIEYKTIEQVLTNRRVFYKRGLIWRDTDEIRVDAVEGVSVRQTLVGRILGYGSIDFSGRGATRLSFNYVPRPIRLKRDFESLIYEQQEDRDRDRYREDRYRDDRGRDDRYREEMRRDDRGRDDRYRDREPDRDRDRDIQRFRDKNRDRFPDEDRGRG